MEVGDNENNIFKATTIQTQIFKTLCDSLKEVLQEVNFNFVAGNHDSDIPEERGSITTTALDATKTIMVFMKLDGGEFQQYDCKKDVNIGVHMANFNKLIKTATNNDSLTLSLMEDETQKLNIVIKNGEDEGVSNITTLKLKLIEVDNIKARIPRQEYDTMKEMPSSEFQKIIRDMANLSDEVEIKKVGNEITFECVGEYAEQKTVHIKKGECEEIVYENSDEEEVYQGRFNLKHLNLFLKCTNLSQVVTLYFENDKPLIIEYKVGSLGFIRFVLAPIRKEEEDEEYDC